MTDRNNSMRRAYEALYGPVGNEVISKEDLEQAKKDKSGTFVGVDFAALELRILSLWAMENGKLTLQDYMDMLPAKGQEKLTWEQARGMYNELRELVKNVSYGIPPLMSVKVPELTPEATDKLRKSFREAFDRLKVDPCHVPIMNAEVRIFNPRSATGRFNHKEPFMDQLVDVYRESPECPACGSEMIKRTAQRGELNGGQFWGCGQFPRCRGTRTLNEVNSTPPKLYYISVEVHHQTIRLRAFRQPDEQLEFAKILRLSQVIRNPGVLYTEFVEPGSRAFCMEEVDFSKATWRAIGIDDDHHEDEGVLRRKIVEKSKQLIKVEIYHNHDRHRLFLKAKLGASTVAAGIIREEDAVARICDNSIRHFIRDTAECFNISVERSCRMLNEATKGLSADVCLAFDQVLLNYNFKPRVPAATEDVAERSKPMKTTTKVQPNLSVVLHEDRDKIELYLMDSRKHLEHASVQRHALQREGALRDFVQRFLDTCVKLNLGSGELDGKVTVLKVLLRDMPKLAPNYNSDAFHTIGTKIHDIAEIMLEKLRAPPQKASFADGSPSAEVQRRWAKAAMEEGSRDLYQHTSEECPTCRKIGGCMCPRPGSENVPPPCTCERLVKIAPQIATELGYDGANWYESHENELYACVECHAVTVCTKLKPRT